MIGENAGSPVRASKKFQDPDTTADGSERACVALTRLETLWINTGTLCNVECAHCYIESSPANDRLAYVTAVDVAPFLDEALELGAETIGLTGGEPFLNPDATEIIGASLRRGFDVLILTNAMRPMMRPHIQKKLLALKDTYGNRLTLRVSIDHYTRKGHDEERGSGAFEAGLAGLRWLIDNGFDVAIAGRTFSTEAETDVRAGFAKLFKTHSIALDAGDPAQLIIFPEMDAARDVPEITAACWGILGKEPSEVMCASSRMLVKRKGAPAPVVLSCTLLPYDREFEMGASLKEASAAVKLNHPFCAQFCVLGGASCSS
ncbi:radical SAM protein [Hyphococcus sp.]|uniref:radical SAM protein n=1 Tax=Hyphococcus sp. TaxID=2038636 RepID=UPI003CCBABA3